MSKQVSDREHSTRSVVDGLAENKSAIAAAQTALLTPAALRLGKVVPDIELLLELYRETLVFGIGELSTAQALHAQEALDDADPRDRRGRAERGTRDHLGPLRMTVAGIYGDKGLRTLGFWEPLPSSVETLRKYGETVLDALQRRDLALTPLIATSATTFDAAGHAAALRPVLAELAAALAQVSVEEVQLDATLVAKNAKMKTHDRNFVGMVGIVEQMMRAAGLVELADRLRPSTGEPGVLIEVREGRAEPPGPRSSDTEPTVGGTTDGDEEKPKVPIAPGMPGAEPFDDEP